MSMRLAGRASRKFIAGTRLCPPARIFPSSPCMARRSSASSTVRGAKYLNETGFIGDGGSRTGAVCSLSQFFVDRRERALIERECLVTRRPASLRHQLVHVVTHLVQPREPDAALAVHIAEEFEHRLNRARRPDNAGCQTEIHSAPNSQAASNSLR